MAKDFKTWIYHVTEQPKVIMNSEFKAYEKEGWVHSPADLSNTKTTDFGVDPDDTVGVQAVGEEIEGYKDRFNGALNIDIMTKKQLEKYARKHFDVELDRRKTAEFLKDQVRKLLNPDKALN